MGPRQFYLLGFGLALVGTLATGASLALAGSALSVLALAAAVPQVTGLVKFYGREGFAMEPTLTYRVVNWCGAVIVFGLGLVMIAVGYASFGAFA